MSMSSCRLVRPDKTHEKRALEYLAECDTVDGGVFHAINGLDRYRDDYDGWLKKLEADRQQKQSAGRVPAETFFMMRKLPRPLHLYEGTTERIVGMVNIRLALNDKLWQYGGNIGYSIRPRERGKGYAKIQLFLALCYCQNRDMDAVLLDCNKTNLGTAKTMLALSWHCQDNASIVG